MRMRHAQAGLVDELLAVDENIEIQHARAPALAVALASGARSIASSASSNARGAELGSHLRDGIDEIRLVGASPRRACEKAASARSRRVCGRSCERISARSDLRAWIGQIAAEADVDGFATRIIRYRRADFGDAAGFARGGGVARFAGAAESPRLSTFDRRRRGKFFARAPRAAVFARASTIRPSSV